MREEISRVYDLRGLRAHPATKVVDLLLSQSHTFSSFY